MKKILFSIIALFFITPAIWAQSGSNSWGTFVPFDSTQTVEIISSNLDAFDVRGLGMEEPGRFLSIDPHASRYPSFSPYVYVANNPLRFIDPDGRDIRIRTGEYDDNDEPIYVDYVGGMSTDGFNTYTANVIERLNEIFSTGSGSIVLSTLIDTENIYTISDRTPGGGAAGYNASNRTLSLSNMLVSDSYRSFDVAHEIFHGYQHEVGFISQGDRLVNAEVGAFLFSEVIMIEQGYSSHTFSPAGSDFSNTMATLLSNGFNNNAYNTAINTFQSQSSFNSSGAYNNYKVVNPSRLPTPPIRRFLR